MAIRESELTEVSAILDGYVRVVTGNGNSRIISFTDLRRGMNAQAAVEPWDARQGVNPPVPDRSEAAPWYRITHDGFMPSVGFVHVGDNVYWSHASRDWFKIDNTEKFISINGYEEGVVELDTDDIDEAGNLYFTDERAIEALTQAENVFTQPQIFENSVQIASKWMGEVDGNFCSAVNAYFEDGEWLRFDESRPAWVQQYSIATNVHGKSHKGLTLWRCEAGSNPINDYGEAGGWLLATSVNGETSDFSVGGRGIEIENTDVVGRLQHFIENDVLSFGLSTNKSFDGQKEDEDENATFLGWIDDEFKIQFSATGSSSWDDLLNLDTNGTLIVKGRLGQKSDNNENPNISQVITTDGGDEFRKSSHDHLMKSGAQYIDTDDIEEGEDNLYFEDQRAIDAVKKANSGVWHEGNFDPSDYVEQTQKGAADGVATLDNNTRIPLEQMPTSVRNRLEYKGSWNPVTNTPTLPTPSAQIGAYYRVSVDGTHDGVTYEAGDWIVSTGSSWDRRRNSSDVTSVHGRSGAVVGQTGDYDSGQVVEGTNLYFTEQRVRNTTLPSLDLSDSSAITSDDSVEEAFGKTQAQFNALGSAASRNEATLQQALDGTGNGLMTPPLVHQAFNQWGWGADSLPVVENLNNISTTMLVYSNGTINSPTGVAGFCQHIQEGEDEAYQAFFAVNGRKYYRLKNNGVWDDDWSSDVHPDDVAFLNAVNVFQQSQTLANNKAIGWETTAGIHLPLITLTGEDVFEIGSSDADTVLRGEVYAGHLSVDNILIDGNSITSRDTNGDITIDPNGGGNIQLVGPTNIDGDTNIQQNLNVVGDTVLHGSLHIKGTATIIDSVEVNIGDNILRLNANHTGSPVLDAGIEVERGNETNVSFLWDESTDRWTTGGEALIASQFIGDGSQITNLTWGNITGIPASATRGEISAANISNPGSTTQGFISGRRFNHGVTNWWDVSGNKAKVDALRDMAFLDKATQAQAEAGTSDSVGMTPLRDRQAMEAFALSKDVASVGIANASSSSHQTGTFKPIGGSLGGRTGWRKVCTVRLYEISDYDNSVKLYFLGRQVSTRLHIHFRSGIREAVVTEVLRAEHVDNIRIVVDSGSQTTATIFFNYLYEWEGVGVFIENSNNRNSFFDHIDWFHNEMEDPVGGITPVFSGVALRDNDLYVDGERIGKDLVNNWNTAFGWGNHASAGYVPSSRSISTGTGLSGGGNLTANRTLSVSFGTAAGTVTEGNDPRLSNARDWTASTVSQAEAETGTATTARKWTAQRVRQAIAAWWSGYSSSIGKSLATAQSAQEARQTIGAVTGSDVTDQLGQMAFLDKAGKTNAELGTSDALGMTPLRTKEAIAVGTSANAKTLAKAWILPSTGSTYDNQWAKVAEYQITNQYHDHNDVFQVLAQSSGMAGLIAGRLSVRIKQQATLGSAPFTDLIYEPVAGSMTAEHFTLVIVENTTSVTRVELWVKNPITHNVVNASLLLSGGSAPSSAITYYTPNQSAYQEDLPAGVVKACRYPTGKFRDLETGPVKVNTIDDGVNDLQVGGDARITGNTGFGASDATEKVDIAGNARIREENAMKFGGTGASDSQFEIRFNSETKSLDFNFIGV